MEGYSRKDENCPKLLDLLQKENEKWGVKSENEIIHGFSDEKKLQLSLGPPGGDGDLNFSNINHKFISPWCSSSSSAANYQLKNHQQQQQKASFLQNLSVTPKESSQLCCNSTAEKKRFSPTTAVTNSAQKRTAPAPVVGWPPIRSFRKNLASSSSLKSVSESPNVVSNKNVSKKTNENNQKGKFVKINMDGIPIGRKVDLKAYDSYEKLSSAVDELFRGLLAAQSNSSGGKIENNDEREKSIKGILDGSGEYTLLYEDNEGDRMLVGNDVPWHMFVSTVKRLRVMKRSKLPMLCHGVKSNR